MAEVTLPQLGETVTEGTITRWFKKVGDAVSADEALFEVSTDKVDTEVPSPITGTLTEIRVQEGDTVPVGAVIAVVGEAADAPAPAAEPEPEPEAAAARSLLPRRNLLRRSRSLQCPSLLLRRSLSLQCPLSKHWLRLNLPLPPSQWRPPLMSRCPPTTASCRQSFVGLSPSTTSTSTSSRGRAQVEGSPATTCSTTSIALRSPPRLLRLRPRLCLPLRRLCLLLFAAPPSSPAPSVAAGERDSTVPLSKIRKLTGSHMVMSKGVSPHAFSVVEVDFANVDVARNQVKADWKATEGFGLTYLPFITRAVVEALDEFPHLNASVSDEDLVVHNFIDIGIAVDLDYQGLLVPVVRAAETKRLRAIAREINDLAGRARSRKLSPDEISGGTFTISNNGSAGSVLTMPIINQPQVAILSTDAITRKPVVVRSADGGEGIAIHPVGNVAMAWDHRAFDGAYAAGFLVKIKQTLETRDWSAEL